MKVLLIRYHDGDDVNTRLPESLNKVRGVTPPLGLAYIASYLEANGHSADIIDAIADNLTRADLEKKIREFAPDIVGVTSMTSNLPGALEAAKTAKTCGVKVVIGGSHMSAYPAETMTFDYIDYGIAGDGEVPMLELVNALEKGLDISSVKGLIYRDNGKIIQNDVYVHMNLDTLPVPAYHKLPMEKYGTLITENPIGTLISTRGCPYKCGYCFSQATDKYHRRRNPNLVVDEMEMLIKRYRVKELMFYDDSICINKNHMRGICTEIINRQLKLKWESPCRIDNVDYDLLKIMKKSGCSKLRFGVESGNPEILKLMNKRITLEQVEKVFQWCREIGIITFAYFIIGYVNETDQTITDTIEFSKKIDADFAMFTIATPYPFTNLYDLAIEKGIVKGDYWRDFTLGKTEKRIPYCIENGNYWIQKAYKEFYFRPKYALKKIFSIRSFSEVKNMISAFKAILLFKMS